MILLNTRLNMLIISFLKIDKECGMYLFLILILIFLGDVLFVEWNGFTLFETEWILKNIIKYNYGRL